MRAKLEAWGLQANVSLQLSAYLIDGGTAIKAATYTCHATTIQRTIQANYNFVTQKQSYHLL